MKTRLVPVYFGKANDEEFVAQVNTITDLLTDEADILIPVAIGSSIPDTDAVVFPQLIGEVYKHIKDIQKIKIPIIIITSEFGTVAMWDWEIVTFMKANGVKPFTPYDLEMTKTICRALKLKKELGNIKFLVFQDNPGEGMQASIFKRFYWWENECADLMHKKFGVHIVKKSYRELCETAKAIPDARAEETWKQWSFSCQGLSTEAIYSAVKIYIAAREITDQDGSIRGIGSNCLNESFFSDSTPCLAWNMLYEEKGIVWACEADTISLLTEYIINKSLNVPVMMSNVYPFLMGMAALKHEKIDKFPEVKDPDNHILVVHCGYTGLMPRCMCTEWTLKPKVLAIVNEKAVMADCRIPIGDVTLVKLHPSFNKLLVIEGDLEEYVQYPGSDCRNGALISVKDGRKIMADLYSHHDILITGHKGAELKVMAKVLGLDSEEI
jgi:hypothetical protein